MNNIKINQLPENTSPNLSGVTVVSDGDATYKVSLQNIKGFRVYSALLTQISSTISNSSLTIGEKYVISDYNDGSSFGNVAQVLSGTTLDTEGCIFIATGTTPTSWCGSTLTIISESAPVATVLENTLGFTPQWEYITLGVYGFTHEGAFPIEKTFVYTPFSFNEQFGPGFKIYDNTNFPDTFIVTSQIIGGPGDETFYYTPLEIKVYN
jgi:hypothetical protein